MPQSDVEERYRELARKIDSLEAELPDEILGVLCVHGSSRRARGPISAARLRLV